MDLGHAFRIQCCRTSDSFVKLRKNSIIWDLKVTFVWAVFLSPSVEHHIVTKLFLEFFDIKCKINKHFEISAVTSLWLVGAFLWVKCRVCKKKLNITLPKLHFSAQFCASDQIPAYLCSLFKGRAFCTLPVWKEDPVGYSDNPRSWPEGLWE